MSPTPETGPGAYQSTGVYKIKSIAELTGYNPNLLRAWERRYQLLAPERKPSGHRLYTEDDRTVLMAVRALMAEGRSIGEIAARGRQELLIAGRSAAPSVEQTATEEAEERPQIVRLRTEIVEAARELNSARLELLLDESFATLDRETVFDTVMVWAIRKIGDLWGRGEASVAHERLASELFCRRIYQWWAVVNRQSAGGPRVVTACLPDEQHEMGALLVTYYLSGLGAEVTYLGSLPLTDLEVACRKLQPRLGLLSVTRAELFEVHQPRLCEVVHRLGDVHFVIGGYGVHAKKRELARLGAQHWPTKRSLSELETLLAGASA